MEYLLILRSTVLGNKNLPHDTTTSRTTNPTLRVIESALEGIAGVQLTYLDGTLDIIAPISPEHEDFKSTIGLLLEAYLREKGIRFYVRGGPTRARLGSVGSLR